MKQSRELGHSNSDRQMFASASFGLELSYITKVNIKVLLDRMPEFTYKRYVGQITASNAEVLTATGRCFGSCALAELYLTHLKARTKGPKSHSHHCKKVCPSSQTTPWADLFSFPNPSSAQTQRVDTLLKLWKW